jgi:hypothetical protein
MILRLEDLEISPHAPRAITSGAISDESEVGSAPRTLYMESVVFC